MHDLLLEMKGDGRSAGTKCKASNKREKEPLKIGFGGAEVDDEPTVVVAEQDDDAEECAPATKKKGRSKAARGPKKVAAAVLEPVDEDDSDDEPLIKPPRESRKVTPVPRAAVAVPPAALATDVLGLEPSLNGVFPELDAFPDDDAPREVPTPLAQPVAERSDMPQPDGLNAGEQRSTGAIVTRGRKANNITTKTTEQWTLFKVANEDSIFFGENSILKEKSLVRFHTKSVEKDFAPSDPDITVAHKMLSVMISSIRMHRKWTTRQATRCNTGLATRQTTGWRWRSR